MSSRHRTPRFKPLPGDFFFGVKVTPFFPGVVFFRRGEARAGEDACGAARLVAMGNVVSRVLMPRGTGDYYQRGGWPAVQVDPGEALKRGVAYI